MNVELFQAVDSTTREISSDFRASEQRMLKFQRARGNSAERVLQGMFSLTARTKQLQAIEERRMKDLVSKLSGSKKPEARSVIGEDARPEDKRIKSMRSRISQVQKRWLLSDEPTLGESSADFDGIAGFEDLKEDNGPIVTYDRLVNASQAIGRLVKASQFILEMNRRALVKRGRTAVFEEGVLPVMQRETMNQHEPSTPAEYLSEMRDRLMRYKRRVQVIQRDRGITELVIFPRTITIRSSADAKLWDEKEALKQQEHEESGGRDRAASMLFDMLPAERRQSYGGLLSNLSPVAVASDSHHDPIDISAFASRRVSVAPLDLRTVQFSPMPEHFEESALTGRSYRSLSVPDMTPRHVLSKRRDVLRKVVASPHIPAPPPLPAKPPKTPLGTESWQVVPQSFEMNVNAPPAGRPNTAPAPRSRRYGQTTSGRGQMSPAASTQRQYEHGYVQQELRYGGRQTQSRSEGLISSNSAVNPFAVVQQGAASKLSNQLPGPLPLLSVPQLLADAAASGRYPNLRQSLQDGVPTYSQGRAYTYVAAYNKSPAPGGYRTPPATPELGPMSARAATIYSARAQPSKSTAPSGGGVGGVAQTKLQTGARTPSPALHIRIPAPRVKA
eukprot:TRINITY_DN13316_c0_g1_i1.p1 TRINITY_DN13316_c0_g1~~TRINITY_DN13316_c0_g1_i1.p1  ORF type:complete len:616 (-),score=115.66 TRINITY_DN13316_c0_g1_i1:63-1910(-)